MYAAFFCRVDPARERDRLRLRAEHLTYIVSHQEQIVAGGPTLTSEGNPETMILLVTVRDLADAEAFIQSEPYTQHGVFNHVDIRAWARVLPEPQAGSLQAALDSEFAQQRGSGS